MDWQNLFVGVIDMRSFSSVWYWIALAVFWSVVVQRPLGIPYDMVIRARRHGGAAMRDLEDIVRMQVDRFTDLEGNAGLWRVGLACFVLSALATLWFHFGVEMALALFLPGASMVPVGLVTWRSARRIRRSGARGTGLCRRIRACQLSILGIGTVSMFITAFWGMYVNTSSDLLGR